MQTYVTYAKFNFKIFVGPGKNPKLINVEPTFIQDYRVGLYPQLNFQIVCYVFRFNYSSDSIKEWT